MPLLAFEAVSKSFDGSKFAVRDLDMEVRDGEFLTLLGPSGSGKTTTLMMLAGFEAPTRGQILRDGERLDSTPSHKRNFGFVFQNYALFPHLSVLENIMFPLRLRKVAREVAASSARRALDMVRLPHCETRAPSALSGGQQQRVALARALVFQPDVILMDEPLSALDKKLREEMQIELKHLHANLGVTFVFVTHDQDEALTMSDRIAVFDDGRLQQIGEPNALYDAPANPFVAQFVGDINVLRCEIVERSESGALTVRLADGVVVTDVCGEGMEVGAAALLHVRPERLKLSAEINAHEIVAATLREVVYRGSYGVLSLEMRSGELLTVMQLSSDLPKDLSEGRSLGISFERSRGIAFPVR